MFWMHPDFQSRASHIAAQHELTFDAPIDASATFEKPTLF
ncbi:hypothetical protein J2793_002481 [Paraburkholderia caledonica]|uniref:Uncharacterized protein n=1 Tax=Paraburkholderia caledonica TaxID=134536 RepID=A0AB73IAH7_9BURK|nr:hypothetical protein [Paraburkholderia caledonica]